MIENGQGVDITGISDKSLVALLKKLFRSMKLKQNESGIYLPHQMGLPTHDLTGSPSPHLESSGNQTSSSGLLHEKQSPPSNVEFTENGNDHATVDLRGPSEKEESPRPTKRR